MARSNANREKVGRAHELLREGRSNKHRAGAVLSEVTVKAQYAQHPQELGVHTRDRGGGTLGNLADNNSSSD